MDGCIITLRKWTPRSEFNDTKPEATICERTIAIITPVVLAAIRPFPEAHRAMSLALGQFIVPQAVT